MSYIDFHCDTLSRLYTLNQDKNSNETLFENKGHLDINRLIKSRSLAQFFACFIDRGIAPISASHYEDVFGMIKVLKDNLEKENTAALALSFEDYLKNKENGILSCFLTVEEGGILDGDIRRLKTLYENGIRLITLTWNYENCIGYPHNMSTQTGTGLKPFGMDVIEQMEDLKMLIDVSHLSDAGFYDVLEHTTRPFIASHSCCRALCPHSRNLTDEMIRAIGERQGLVGLNFYGTFLSPDKRSTIDAILKHLKHLINIGGIDIAAIGTDYDGMDGYLELAGCQDLPKLIDAMEKDKFTSSQIDAICFKNAERVLSLI